MASTSSGSVPYPTSDSETTNAAGSTPPVVERVAGTAHKVVDQLASKAGPAVERVKSGVNTAKDAMHTRLDGLSTTRDEWMESCRHSVRQHPLASVGIGIAMGYLLARLTRER
jgi:ElaB/YqjD/DUF883 family membrane-anchored ribosome-binding protein